MPDRGSKSRKFRGRSSPVVFLNEVLKQPTYAGGRITLSRTPDMTKPPLFPGFDGLMTLSRREGVDIRPTLLRVLTDLYVQASAHSDDEARRRHLAIRYQRRRQIKMPLTTSCS